MCSRQNRPSDPQADDSGLEDLNALGFRIYSIYIRRVGKLVSYSLLPLYFVANMFEISLNVCIESVRSSPIDHGLTMLAFRTTYSYANPDIVSEYPFP
jgi:hypothetical protein